ncbi:MAG: hypothetical protein LKG27_07180 [Clostridiaceae bacterium]|jgi:predicted amidohydrolase|nr:hypothetical protein [Clostridiaceae bacterium]
MENSFNPDIRTFKISAIQMNSKIGDKNANCEKVKQLITRDVDDDVDLIVLPEVWTVGWSCPDFRASAENFKKSKVINFLSDIAKKYNSFVVGGSIIEKTDDGRFLNTSPVFDRSGNLIAKYSKMHLFSYYGDNEGSYVEVGDNPVLVDMDRVKVGLTVCFDIRFPEIYRAYRKCGADLFVNCAAWGLKKPIPWEAMTRSRAVEEQTYMVALTQSGLIKDEDYNIGHSRILDYKGETLSEIKDQKEGAMTAVINLNEMYEFRDKCTILNDIRKSYEVECV